jgi:predicted transposase
MMLLTVKLKFNPTNEQLQALLTTMEQFNAACNYIATVSFQERTFGQVGLQKRFITTLVQLIGTVSSQGNRQGFRVV